MQNTERNKISSYEAGVHKPDSIRVDHIDFSLLRIILLIGILIISLIILIG